jgi:excisionase family DNA binding protein
MKARLKETTGTAALEAGLHMAENAEAGTHPEKPRAPKRNGGEIPYAERVYDTTKHTTVALGICLDTLYRLMRAGKIRSIKIGKRRLVEVASVLELSNVDDLPKYAAKPAAKADEPTL